MTTLLVSIGIAAVLIFIFIWWAPTDWFGEDSEPDDHQLVGIGGIPIFKDKDNR